MLLARTVAGVALTLTVVSCDAASDAPASPYENTSTVAAESTDAPAAVCGGTRELPAVYCTDTAGMERATVVDIIDGDTLDVILDGREERIRIFGIDTPERGDRCFSEASDLLAELAGAEIRMRIDVRKVDRNGRLLRYVYQPGGLSIDAVMIAAGAAYAWTRDGALRDDLVALEAEARAGRTGCLWG